MPWKEFSGSNQSVWDKYGSSIWDSITDSYLPEGDRKTTSGRLYDDFIRPLGSPLGVLSLLPGVKAARRFGQYAKKGVVAPTPVVRTGPKPGVLETLRDEAKQISMTFGLPGTGVSKHGIALATAHLKSTPLKELPKEAYETARMLWNPERAIRANKKLTGGTNPFRMRQDIENTLTQSYPHMNPNTRAFKSTVESILDAYALAGPGTRNSRFKDILELERPTSIGGGGLKTSDVLAGSSKGSMAERQILTHPIKVGGYNLNPFSIQKEVFDTPLFGEDYINTYFKRKTALRELDRVNSLQQPVNIVNGQQVRQLPIPRQDALKQASDYATNVMGGFGIDSPSVFNSKAAKWLLTAPDWTRRHFTLANNKIQSVRPKNLRDQKYAPYRRYLGYDAAGLGLTGAANYALNNQMPDRATDIFNVELPKNSDYSTRDIFTPWATEMDLPKSLVDISNNIGPQAGWYGPDTKGLDSAVAPWRNRIHPFTRPILETVMNQTWRGGRMMGEEGFSKPSRDLFGNVMRERPDIPQGEEWKRVSSNFLNSLNPQAVSAVGNLFGHDRFDKTTSKEKYSPLSLLSQMFELPFTTYTPRYTKVETPLDRRMKRVNRNLSKFK